MEENTIDWKKADWENMAKNADAGSEASFVSASHVLSEMRAGYGRRLKEITSGIQEVMDKVAAAGESPSLEGKTPDQILGLVHEMVTQSSIRLKEIADLKKKTDEHVQFHDAMRSRLLKIQGVVQASKGLDSLTYNVNELLSDVNFSAAHGPIFQLRANELERSELLVNQKARNIYNMMEDARVTHGLAMSELGKGLRDRLDNSRKGEPNLGSKETPKNGM